MGVSLPNMEQLVHGSQEAFQRPVDDLYGVAQLEAHADLTVLHTQREDLLLGERDGFAVGAHEACAASAVADKVPAFVGEDHLHQHIAGKDLALYFLIPVLRAFDHGLLGDVHFLDKVLHLPVFRALHNGSGDGVLVTGIGVDHIP